MKGAFRLTQLALTAPSRSLVRTLLLPLTFIDPTSLAATPTPNFIRGDATELNDNGAWSWFMDERALVDQGRLLVGSVRAVGEFGDHDQPGWGNVELAILDLATSQRQVVVLHEHFEQDDHNGPGLLRLGDGRYLAIYSKHNQEAKFYFRISREPGDPYHWGPIQEVTTPGVAGNFRGDSVTYSNPHRLSAENGRIYLFHRGVGNDPNDLVSEDDGRSWRYGGKLFVGRQGYSPYAKYASNGRDTIHFVATENHPRNFNNSLYHGSLRSGQLRLSDGTPLGPLATSTNTPYHAWDFTRVYEGGPTNVAWMTDLELDEAGNPVVLFTTQRDGAGLPMGAGGLDHRFHYGRWTDNRWVVHEIAYAGTRLYPGEDDYTGLGAIHPRDASTVFLSTDADPASGRPLISRANFRRHHELFRGRTRDGGRTWQWTAITSNSTTDNLRPIVPDWDDPRTALVWMRGAYRVNRGEWGTRVMATLLNAEDEP